MTEPHGIVYARRVLTDVFSMTPWPMEMAGAYVLWHYGKLFSSSLGLSRDYRSILAAIMPGDVWGLMARGLAVVLAFVLLVSLLTPLKMVAFRVALAVLGLVVWGVLVYSCWRGDVPHQIWELYAFFLGAQAYIAALLQVRRRAGDDN